MRKIPEGEGVLCTLATTPFKKYFDLKFPLAFRENKNTICTFFQNIFTIFFFKRKIKIKILSKNFFKYCIMLTKCCLFPFGNIAVDLQWESYPREYLHVVTFSLFFLRQKKKKCSFIAYG